MKSLIPKLALINDEESFKMVYKFGIKEYLQDRKLFAKTCRGHATHIEKVTHDTGIANVVNGGLGITAGVMSITGICLAPFTAGLSLGLTVGGLAGGVAAAVGSLAANLVKDVNINNDVAKINAALAKFEEKEKIIFDLFSSIQEDMSRLHKLVDDPKVLDYIKNYGSMATSTGYGIMFNGYRILTTIKTINVARGVASFVGADVMAMRGIAEGISAPYSFARFGLAAGSTTAKMLGGVLGVAGIGLNIWQIIDSASDITASKLADQYRTFADGYEKQTDEIGKTLDNIKTQMAQC